MGTTSHCYNTTYHTYLSIMNQLKEAEKKASLLVQESRKGLFGITFCSRKSNLNIMLLVMSIHDISRNTLHIRRSLFSTSASRISVCNNFITDANYTLCLMQSEQTASRKRRVKPRHLLPHTEQRWRRTSRRK